MVDLSRGLQHLAWANDRVFARLIELPREAMAAQYAPDVWTVGRLATHIVGSSEWYVYCLTGQPWTDLPVAAGPEDLARLRTHLADLDAVLVAEGEQEDGPITFRDGDGDATWLRSTILHQAVLHAVEHRAQIACALAANGYPALSLDDIDVWAFEWDARGGTATA